MNSLKYQKNLGKRRDGELELFHEQQAGERGVRFETCINKPGYL